MITSVDLEDGFYGRIETTTDKIEWQYEKWSKCCERISVVITYGDREPDFTPIRKSNCSEIEDLLVGKKIITYDFEPDVRGQYANLTFRLDEGPDLVILFRNIHNGYYVHNVDVLVNDEIRWNAAL